VTGIGRVGWDYLDGAIKASRGPNQRRGEKTAAGDRGKKKKKGGKTVKIQYTLGGKTKRRILSLAFKAGRQSTTQKRVLPQQTQEKKKGAEPHLNTGKREEDRVQKK